MFRRYRFVFAAAVVRSLLSLIRPTVADAQIFVPQAGEVWVAGTTSVILWTLEGASEGCNIYVSPEPFTDRYILAANIPVNPVFPSLNAYVWVIPASAKPGRTRIIIEDAEDANNLVDQEFIIQAGKKRELQGIEITQCVQNWNNDVPLIKGKPTYIVAHILSSEQNDDFDVTVRNMGGGPNAVQTWHVKALYTNDAAKATYRREKDTSFVHPLPPDWCGGNDLTLIMEAEGLVAKSNYVGLVLSDGTPGVQVPFTAVPNIKVCLVPLAWVDELGIPHPPTKAEINGVLDALRSTIPAGDVIWQPFLGESAELNMRNFTFGELVGKPEDARDFRNIIKNLYSLRVVDKATFDDVYYVGLVGGARDAGGGPLGYAAAPTGIVPRACALYCSPWSVASHEVGHCLGREHAGPATGDPKDPGDPQNPLTVSFEKDQNSNNAFFGMDHRSLAGSTRLVGPSVGDMMTPKIQPGADRWPSAYTYTNEMAYLRSHKPVVGLGGMVSLSLESPRSVPLVTAGLSGGATFMITGVVSTNPVSARIQHVRTIDAYDSAPPPPGDWVVVFEDGVGQALASYAFSPSFGSEGGGDEGFFVLVLPWAADARRVVLLHDGAEMDTVGASAHAPEVSLLEPSGDTWTNSPLTVRWTASDVDGDLLRFDLQFSTDEGSNWTTIALGTTNTSVDVVADTLPGTTQAVFRVLASDGFHTTEARTSSPGSLSARPPTVTIMSPGNSDRFSGPVDIAFKAIAYDLQDGELTTNGVTWLSNRDGVLGTGATVNVIADALSEGDHVMTFDAVNSSGLHATQSVAITVVRDANLNGLPDWWETEYFDSPTAAVADKDTDKDGMNNLEEFIADTNPTNSASLLKITGIEVLPAGVRVGWTGGTGAWQYLEITGDLALTGGTRTVILTNTPPTSSSTNIMDARATNRLQYYRIRAYRP